VWSLAEAGWVGQTEREDRCIRESLNGNSSRKSPKRIGGGAPAQKKKVPCNAARQCIGNEKRGGPKKRGGKAKSSNKDKKRMDPPKGRGEYAQRKNGIDQDEGERMGGEVRKKT